MSDNIKLIIGLGNPGANYRNTYHNIGMLVFDCLIKQYIDIPKPEFKRRGKLFEYYKNKNVVWIKSLVFMNESGLAIKQAAEHFNVEPKKILVIHDDSDLYVGKFKLSFNRGSAGHKGAKSVIKSLGTKAFWRLRIGIRPRAAQRKKAGDFVLKKINSAQRKILESMAGEVIAAMEPMLQT